MLKKPHRLGKSGDVERVVARGRGFFNHSFSIRYSPGPVTRFAVVVSTKVSKSAVRRNRIKRIVREHLKRNLLSFPPGDYVVAARQPCGKAEDKTVLANLKDLTARILRKKP